MSPKTAKKTKKYFFVYFWAYVCINLLMNFYLQQFSAFLGRDKRLSIHNQSNHSKEIHTLSMSSERLHQQPSTWINNQLFLFPHRQPIKWDKEKQSKTYVHIHINRCFTDMSSAILIRIIKEFINNTNGSYIWNLKENNVSNL